MKESKQDIRVVVLAGGQGSRFWPISRMKRPKQFLSISSSGESLLQATVRRTSPLSSEKDTIIVTNIVHEPLIREHVPTAEVISEPVARNTAASIGLAAIHVKRKNPEAVMIVLPADHSVKDEGKLIETLQKAVKLASSQDLLVTIGVPPAYPNTGYGYIRRGAELNASGYMVRRFFEKPNLERAIEYAKSPEFYWNSGMFVWRASVILEALEEYLPQLYSALLEIEKVIGTPKELDVTRDLFENLEGISIDFGVLEHARNCAVVPAEPFGWNDVGSWDAWAEHFETDENNNLIHGEVLAIDSSNCVMCGDSRLLAVLGLQDVVIIDSGDALLVCPRKRVQDVRKIVDELKARGRSDLT